ncbi:MAG: alpha/beta fold hydrolase [Polyangiaceae bacterium]
MTLSALVAWRCLLVLGLGMVVGTVTGCLGFHRGAIEGEPRDASFVEVAGARLRIEDSGGEGPPVLLIHGFASSLDAWKTVVPALVDRHRVIAVDLKGFGWSDRPAGDYSPRAQAAMLLELLDQLKVERVALVAHSWGSSVALALALQAPERVTRIALYDAWVYEEQLPTTFLMARASGVGETLFGLYYRERPEDKVALAFYDERFVTQELVDTINDQLDRPGTTAAALAAVRGQRFSEMQAMYRKIEQPVLLLWGREDRVTLLEFGERLSLELPNAKLAVYPQCGHFPMIEAKNPSNRDLRAFLEADLVGPPALPPVAVPAPPPPTPVPEPEIPEPARGDEADPENPFAP